MGFIDNMDIYKPEHAFQVFISIALFVLYAIITLMDTHFYIKDMGIGDQIISTGKFIYSYMAGYFAFFLKVTVALASLWILLSIIRVAIIVIFNIFKPVSLGGSGVSEFNKSMSSKIATGLKDNAVWILGFCMVEKFVMTFAAFGPVLFLFITLTYGIRIYNEKSLKRQDEEGDKEVVLKAINTTHHHMMMLLSLVVTSIIVYLASVYLENFHAKNLTS